MKRLLTIAFVILLVVSGCRTPRRISYLEQEYRALRVDTFLSVSRDTVFRILRQNDSVVIRDSIIMDRTGDTIRIDRHHIRERTQMIHDTLRIFIRDTVYHMARDALSTRSDHQDIQHYGRSLYLIFIAIGIVTIIALYVILKKLK